MLKAKLLRDRNVRVQYSVCVLPTICVRGYYYRMVVCRITHLGMKNLTYIGNMKMYIAT